MNSLVTVKYWERYLQSQPTIEILDLLKKSWIDEDGSLRLIDKSGIDLREEFHREFPDLMDREFYVEFYTRGFCGKETIKTTELAEIVGRSPGYVKNVASQIPGAQKTSRGWNFEKRQAVEWFEKRPKPGPKKR